jgi:nucleoside-diphosphate-sugar epimerase
MDRVLITGGSGFLGSCLARRLIAAGQNVNLLLRPGTALWRLTDLDGQFTPRWADLRDAESVTKGVSACKPNVIYHFATHGAIGSQRDRAAVLSTNILGTANLLDALHPHEYRTLVHVGSSSEYGHKAEPIREDDRLEPRTDYAVAKAGAALLCQAEAYQGRPVAIVRVFSAYGPWEERSRLASYVMRCCRQGVTPSLTSGIQPRDFIYVDDVIDLIRLAGCLPQARGEILHAGSGNPCRVRDMVETIMSVCDTGMNPLTPGPSSGERRETRAEFGAEAMRPDEPAYWAASIERTTAITGWKPRYGLRQGVEAMWSWFQKAQSTKLAA